MIIPVTVDSTACLLMAMEPHGSVAWTLSRLVDVQQGQTLLEERHVLGITLRNKLEWTVSAWDRIQGAAYLAASRDPSNKPVLCPFWPGAVPYGTAALATSSLNITWEPDFAAYQIHMGAAPSGWTPSSSAWTAPLLWGRWDKMPSQDLDNAVLFDGELTFIETGPASYAITPVATVTYGPTIQGAARPLLAFDCRYDKFKAAIDINITRERLGFGRDEATTYQPQQPRRMLQMTVEGEAPDMMRLAAIFHACGGTVAPLWFPSGYSPTELTANTSSGSSVVNVQDVSLLGNHPYLILRNAYGTDVARQIVSSVGNALTLNSSPGTLEASSTSVQALYLGRFRTPELKIVYRSSIDFTAQFGVTELPTDYSNPSGYVYGTNYGQLDPDIPLFKITDAIGTVWYWTSWESAVTINGATWQPKQITYDKISRGIYNESRTTIKADSWTGSPFLRLLKPRRGLSLAIEILSWDLVSGTAKSLYSGTAFSANRKGKSLNIPVRSEWTDIMEAKVPRQLDGPDCSHTVYDPLTCKLSKAAKLKAGTLVSLVSTYVIRVQLSSSAAAHAFAGGWLMRAAPGDGSPSYAILDSTASSANQVDLTLDMPLAPALVVSEAVTIYPGCDCTWDACVAHGNTANYGGSPRKPASNPAFTAVKDTTPSNSKK